MNSKEWRTFILSHPPRHGLDEREEALLHDLLIAERRAEALEAENGRLQEALKAARDLYDRLSVETDPLACAAKYGPDYDQPSPEEWTAMCLEIRGKIDAALTPPQPQGKEEPK